MMSKNKASDAQTRGKRYERAALAASIVGLAGMVYVVFSYVQSHGSGQALWGEGIAWGLASLALLLTAAFGLIARREKKKQQADEA